MMHRTVTSLLAHTSLAIVMGGMSTTLAQTPADLIRLPAPRSDGPMSVERALQKEIYNRLAQALNMRSTAYPSIPCEEFYALAAELFIPEQAEIAASMPVEPVSTGKLAARMKTSDVVGLGRQLDEMTDRGLVRVKEEARNRLYELMPLVPGIIELQFMHGRSDDRTKRLAQLFKSYDKAVKNMLPTAQTPVTVEKPKTRTIVINQEIHSKTTVLPYDEVMKLIEKH